MKVPNEANLYSFYIASLICTPCTGSGSLSRLRCGRAESLVAMVVRAFHGGTRLTSQISIKNNLFLRFGCRKNDGERELWILVWFARIMGRAMKNPCVLLGAVS
jgi:hypothetical protein